MIDPKTLVNDALLKELSVETRKIGSRVIVKAVTNQPAYMADIIDVIIVPQTSFYKSKFMEYYLLYSRNSVKALKELGNNFPFIPDYNLGIAYVLNVEPEHREHSLTDHIKLRSELEFRLASPQLESAAEKIPTSPNESFSH